MFSREQIPELLAELFPTAATAGDASQFLEAALGNIRLRLGISAALAYRLDERCTRLNGLAMSGVPERGARLLGGLAIEKSPLFADLCSGSLPFFTHESEQPRFDSRLAAALSLDDRRWIVMPLRGPDRVVGVMMYFLAGRGAFDAEETDTFSAVTAFLSFGLTVMDRIAGEKRRADTALRDLGTSMRVLRAAEALAENADLAGVLGALADAVHAGFGRRSVVVETYDAPADELVAAAVRGIGLDEGSRRSFASVDPVFRQAVLEQRSALVERDGHAAGAGGWPVYLVVPLIAGGRLVGVIELEEPTAVGPGVGDDARVLEAIAFEATVALENARLFEQQRRSAELRAALNDIDALIGESAGTASHLPRVLQLAADAVRADEGLLAFAEDEWRVAFVTAGSTSSPGSLLSAHDVDDAREAIELGAPIIRGGDSDGEGAGRSSGVLIVPLRQREVVFGAAMFRHPGLLSRVDPETLDFATKLSASLSLGLANLRLLQAEKEAQQRATRELETTRLLLEASQTVSSWTKMDELLEALLDVVLRSVEHSRATVALYDGDEQELRVAGSAGHDAMEPGLVYSRADLTEDTRGVLDGGKTTVVDLDAMPMPDGGRGFLKDSHVALEVPLVVRDHIIGVLTVDDPGSRVEFTGREIARAEGIAAQAAVAIDNARLFEAEREAARLGEELARIDQAVHSTLSETELSKRVTGLVAKALGVDSCMIAFREEGAWSVQADHGGTRSLRDLVTHAPQAAPLFDSAVAKRRIVAVADAASDPRIGTGAASGVRIGGLLLAPLTAPRIDGLLVCNTFGAPRRWTQSETTFVEQVAGSLSLALSNSRLYETERYIADRLQEALIALPVSIEGLEFAHAYHSASEAARVGGDFYDLFEIEPGLVGLTMGDIAGKGLDAAVLTSLVKNTIRAHASEMVKTPATILRLTNEVVWRGTPVEAFATVFFALLETRTGRLVYACAGHTTSVVVRPDGTTEKLEPTGPLLGAFQAVDFDERAVHLDVGSLLFLYTDGLTEARRDGELFGEDRLFDSLEDAAGSSPAQMVGRIRDTVMAFARGQLRDDLALLALRRVERGRPTPLQEKLEI